MFEIDEWDIDEDYMKDFNADDIIKEFDNKKKNETYKLDNENKEKVINTSRIEFNCTTFENELRKEKDSTCVDKISRKNAILDIFKNSDNIKTNSSTKNMLNHNTNQPTVSVLKTTNDFRKNLVLNVFQENKHIPQEKNCSKDTAITKSALRIPVEALENNNENNLKRKKNVAFLESVIDSISVKKKCILASNILTNTTKESNLIQNKDLSSKPLETNLDSKNYKSDTQKQMVVSLLKSPVQKITKTKRIKAPQAVTRKFPGPAGLLPDDVNESEVIDLEYIDENKNNKANKFADICSQNTKNLFTTGAWHLMIDDLPSDFELYDIATVKENALEYSKAYKKIPYLAGMIQYIDYKPNDPQVVLKDLTGKIDARIHHSICKLYPNALGTQIVILVKDVGLIVTSKKYVCLIISLKNLVSLYSDDARLVETPHLEKLLSTNHNCNLNESQISILDEDCENNQKQREKSPSEKNKHLSKDDLNTVSKKDYLFSKLYSEQSKNKQAKDYDQLDDQQNFDFDENDTWLAVNYDDLTSFKSHQFPSSTPMEANKTESNNIVNQSISVDDISRFKTLHKPDETEEFQTPVQKDNKRANVFQNLLSSKHSKKDSEVFGDDEEDLYDELLSQLDVDAIAANYNR